jgi:hypothetical protein
MRRVLVLILLLAMPACGAWTVDTDHALYSNMKGIYVFDGADGSGSNLVGDGRMVGTVEDANGFECPITQSYQSWYEDFGDGYTICIWHEGLDLASNYRAIIIIADRVAWFRNALQSHCRVRHGPTEYANLADLTLASIADPMMLALTHNTTSTTQRAYDGNDLIATGGLTTAPTTSGDEDDLQLPGDGTVTRVYIFDTELSSAQLGALEDDPDSIFTQESYEEEEEEPVAPPVPTQGWRKAPAWNRTPQWRKTPTWSKR